MSVCVMYPYITFLIKNFQSCESYLGIVPNVTSEVDSVYRFVHTGSQIVTHGLEGPQLRISIQVSNGGKTQVKYRCESELYYVHTTVKVLWCWRAENTLQIRVRSIIFRSLHHELLL